MIQLDPADAQAAAFRASLLYPGHRGLRSAFTRGAIARLSGDGVEACPYGRRTRNRRPGGWHRIWRAAWLSGWRFADQKPAISDIQ